MKNFTFSDNFHQIIRYPRPLFPRPLFPAPSLPAPPRPLTLRTAPSLPVYPPLSTCPYICIGEAVWPIPQASGYLKTWLVMTNLDTLNLWGPRQLAGWETEISLHYIKNKDHGVGLQPLSPPSASGPVPGMFLCVRRSTTSPVPSVLGF